jgi:hypothetical protein
MARPIDISALHEFGERLFPELRDKLHDEFWRIYGSRPSALELMSYAIEKHGNAQLKAEWKKHSKPGLTMSKNDLQADARDFQRWQLAQVQTMIDLFTAAHGRGPNTREELREFLDEECAAGRIPPGPIQHSTAALIKVARPPRMSEESTTRK